MNDSESWLAPLVLWVDRQCAPLHPTRPIYPEQEKSIAESLMSVSPTIKQKECNWEEMTSADIRQALAEMGYSGTNVYRFQAYEPEKTDLRQYESVKGRLLDTEAHLQFYLESLEKWESRRQEINNTAILILGMIVTALSALFGPAFLEILESLTRWVISLCEWI